MGLGTKIKNALSPEHPRHGGWEKDTVPGAYPDETSSKLDDKSHLPSHSTPAANKTAGTTGTTATTGTTGTAGLETSTHDRAGDDWDHKGISFADQRAHTAGGSPDRITGKPYNHTTATTGNSSARNSTGYDNATTGRTHGDYDDYEDYNDHDLKHTRKHAHHDSGVDIGMNDRTAERGAGAEGLAGHRTLRKHNAHSSGSPTGGVYNGVTGSGSREDTHTGSREGAHIPHHTDRSSGLVNDSTHDSRYATSDYSPTSRDSRTGLGLTGAGAGAAGVGGAGAAAALAHRHRQDDTNDIYGEHTGTGSHLGRHEYAPATHARSGENGLSHLEGGGGVARSNLLYPESTTATGNTAHTMGATQGHHAPIGGSKAAGPTSSMNPMGTSAPSNSGKNFYGPAHEGAKVMHQCHGCGMDNDISHYFKKDAVYRIG